MKLGVPKQAYDAGKVVTSPNRLDVTSAIGEMTRCVRRNRQWEWPK
ncbi:MAG: hypothetical protein RLY14_2288 [Planctomycetota bacterium]|jgi:hypothetical protein